MGLGKAVRLSSHTQWPPSSVLGWDGMGSPSAGELGLLQHKNLPENREYFPFSIFPSENMNSSKLPVCAKEDTF